MLRELMGKEMEPFVVKLSAEAEEIRKLVEPLLESEGYELVNINFVRAQSASQVTLFIDTFESESGIVLEKLTDLSRYLSTVLDAHEEELSVLAGRYNLEVSSPGLDRPLSKKSHFENAIGELIKVRLCEALADGTKNIKGVITALTDSGIEISLSQEQEETKEIDFNKISQAHIVFQFEKKLKAQKKIA